MSRREHRTCRPLDRGDEAGGRRSPQTAATTVHQRPSLHRRFTIMDLPGHLPYIHPYLIVIVVVGVGRVLYPAVVRWNAETTQRMNSRK
jgi:hypothetical protein